MGPRRVTYLPITSSSFSASLPPPARAAVEVYAFEPSAERVRVLDQRTRLRLGESLRYILKQAHEQLEVSRFRCEQFFAQLETHPVSPLAFSFYSDAVLAIEEDDLAEASRLLERLFDLPPQPCDLRVLNLADPLHDETAARYARFIDTDDSVKFEVFAPSQEAAASCRRQIADAFKLMDAGDPELAAEIRGLLREIILAAGTKEPKGMTFDGASCFMLWGAIIINANRGNDDLGMVQMLAHESAHNLLFGLSADESLVENSPRELFPSPLRLDPRPMDGIYHATFVTARMHRSVARLLASGILSADQQEKARHELEENARLFASGLETVNRHARLTALGKALIERAAAYMAGN